MLFTVADLERDPIEFKHVFMPGTVDFGEALTQTAPLSTEGRVDIIHEHRTEERPSGSGQHGHERAHRRHTAPGGGVQKLVVADIRLRAQWKGEFEIPCARCVDPVKWLMASDFDLIFRPEGVDADGGEHAISTDETEIGYYHDGGLLLEDVLREQVLLSLPVRTLCRTDCKGLCPRCGQNLNQATCDCAGAPADARWNALADLKSRLGN